MQGDGAHSYYLINTFGLTSRDLEDMMPTEVAFMVVCVCVCVVTRLYQGYALTLPSFLLKLVKEN